MMQRRNLAGYTWRVALHQLNFLHDDFQSYLLGSRAIEDMWVIRAYCGTSTPWEELSFKIDRLTAANNPYGPRHNHRLQKYDVNLHQTKSDGRPLLRSNWHQF